MTGAGRRGLRAGIAAARRARRGVAMLAALWLVVGITIVALDFALAAQERRALGIAAADRARASAAALGAFALTRAQLEYALRAGPQSTAGSVGRLQSSDPWLGVDSLYSGVEMVDSLPVVVAAADLGAKLNINALSETELRTFFSYLLGDYVLSDQLAQCISDWRDVDDIPRTKGGERDDYIKAGLLRLPANQDIRDLEELLDVKGMTPEIYALVSPYLTTVGAAQVNLNSAPVPVLRVLPGMTDEIISRILQLRSRGSRITSVAEVMPQPRGGVSDRVAAAMQAQSQNAQSQISARAGVMTQQVELTILAKASPAAKPVRLRVVLGRANINGQPAAGVLNEEWR
ncbi:MAG: type II secretion system protein GspK [Gemmatimonadota bacterium]|nr:type II secretion system protein GspK [Gemmatimonadota bacterium]